MYVNEYKSICIQINIYMDLFIKKGKFLKVLWHFVHVLQSYPKFNNGDHTKPSKVWIMILGTA